ncbi:phosphate ABC transporter substrate-binding protein PstS [Actinoplanes sp. NPDC024001]|uniref:phosphate ABC transporter substrate-binding protein PstS n=1 Tax=Actinoplanes sp. NPDC024001 TaxID=3154598 RepID=UPI0034113B15
MRRAFPAMVAVLALVAGCDGARPPEPPAIACAAGSVSGQGSSAQTGAVNAWIQNYQIACAQAAIEYASTGSGAGVRAFLAGTGDFAGTDTPLSAAEQKRAEARCGGTAVHLPLVTGPIAFVYNVAGVDALHLTPATLAGIFSGKVTVWNDPVIAADNPYASLPATRIQPVHRSDSSGTTDTFTRYLTAQAGKAWAHGSGGTWRAPGGIGQRGSHRAAAAVARTEGAIGYVEASYARVNDLPVAWLGDQQRGFAAPSDYATGRAIESARITDDLRLELDPGNGAYPLVTVTYQVVCQAGAGEATRGFLAYAASAAGQSAAAYAGSVPLPESLRARVADAVAGLR